MLERVAIYFKDNNSKTRECVDQLVKEFYRRGIKIQIFQKSMNQHIGPGWELIEKHGEFSFSSELPDLVLSVGGDGTFLETVLKVKNMGIPIAGVNTGRMGFLANICADEIGNSIDMLCKGEYDVIGRCLLELTKPSDIFEENSSYALNEIAIQKADLS